MIIIRIFTRSPVAGPWSAETADIRCAVGVSGHRRCHRPARRVGEPGPVVLGVAVGAVGADCMIQNLPICAWLVHLGGPPLYAPNRRSGHGSAAPPASRAATGQVGALRARTAVGVAGARGARWRALRRVI